LDSIFASLTKGRIRFNYNFSNIFDEISRKLIGLYEEREFGGLLGFKIRIIVEYFHKIGK
jgi:hypothetical protein